jgi:hypothetical protein
MTMQRSADSEECLGQVTSLAQRIRQADERARSLRRQIAAGAAGKSRVEAGREEQHLEQLVHQMAAVLKRVVDGQRGRAA